MSRYVLALDFGGTKLAADLVEKKATSFRRILTASTPPSEDQSVEFMIWLARQLNPAESGTLVAIGVSFGGPVDSARGIVRRSLHIPGWDDVKLVELLREEFGVPVTVRNDGEAGALGAWWFGETRRPRSLCYVTVGTGIGSGIVVDGHVVEGCDGLAGEVGHIVIDANGAECTCGGRGCAEAIAAGPAIARRAEEAARQSPASATSLIRILKSGRQLSALDVAATAEIGDPISVRYLVEAGQVLGQVAATITCLLNPNVIAFSGGVLGSSTVWSALKAEYVDRRRLQTRTEVTHLKLDHPSLWGAVILANESLSS